MKAVTSIPRITPRPSEFTVPVTGATHEVVEIECDACGTTQAVWPVAALALLCGSHLPCGRCFAESSTRVVRDIDVSDMY